MGNDKQLGEDLQQALTSLGTLSGIAQKIEARFKELEEREAKLKQLEDVVNAKVKEFEGREKIVKESEEKVKATTKECVAKQRKWEEIEKQMEINSQKVKQLVNLNVGMYLFYLLDHCLFIIFN